MTDNRNSREQRTLGPSDDYPWLRDLHWEGRIELRSKPTVKKFKVVPWHRQHRGDIIIAILVGSVIGALYSGFIGWLL